MTLPLRESFRKLSASDETVFLTEHQGRNMKKPDDHAGGRVSYKKRSLTEELLKNKKRRKQK